jgi:thiosulfate sulfurtransferase
MAVIPEVESSRAYEWLREGKTLFVDVRDRMAYLQGHIPGAKNLDDGEIVRFVDSADKAQRIVVYCYAGNFAPGGVDFLRKKGFSDVWTLWGGFADWEETYPALRELGDPRR